VERSLPWESLGLEDPRKCLIAVYADYPEQGLCRWIPDAVTPTCDQAAERVELSGRYFGQYLGCRFLGCAVLNQTMLCCAAETT